MQCRECGFQIAVPALFCPSCGARLVMADPNTGADPGAVQSPSYLDMDATRAQPTIPPAARPPRPAPQAGASAPVRPSADVRPGPAAPPRPASAPAAGSAAQAVPPGPNGAAPGAMAPLSHPSSAGEAVPIQSSGRNPSAQSAGAVVPGKTAAPRKALPQPGDILGGRYRLEKFLGQGSLSNAYLCRDSANGNREVVIRAMHARKAAEPGLADSYLFLADSVSKYSHRGIARIFESGRMGDTPYYAMEWVSGTPLRMWLMERLTFDNRVLPGLGIVLGLIDVFEAIHERGCYGCLKPENVFVGLGGPVVMDFGVVGFLTPQEFEFNSYARRYLPYMAPELRQDWSNLIPHSDFYSLGAILYEVLTGRSPSTPLRLPSAMSDRFGIEADEVVLKAMAQKPQDRFGTLEAFRAAVESLQAALLGAHPQPQPGNEGSRTIRVASDANTVLNPDENFATPAHLAPPLPEAASIPEESSQDSIPAAGQAGSLNGNIWSREPAGGPASDPSGMLHAPGEEAPETLGFAAGKTAEDLGNPYTGEAPDVEGAMRSDFPEGDDVGGTPGEGRGVEAAHAHAMRRVTHSPRGAFPDGELPAPAEGGLRPLSQAVNWEGLADQVQAVPDAEAEPKEEPVPAWLWISIALAGCSMVILSAYFGLLLPR